MFEVREVCDAGNFICFKGEREKECLGMSLGGHSNGKRGYQARPWTHKKHPNHVFFRYEKRP